IIATIISPDHRPQMATVREGVFRLPEPETGRTGQVIMVPVEVTAEDFCVKVIGRSIEEKKVDLKGAGIIVAGGAGVGSREGFNLIRSLADTLGGVVGATRAAVDAGWIGHEHQVGQTGTTVRPKLYIAAGVSGSVQHRAGMDESARILAIDTDPHAPIFSVAHYGIVGDLHEVIPRIITAYRSKA
ncbi:MAG: electron transfer flavoprotein subunit alpha/FixB family protein, partial [bacterium]